MAADSSQHSVLTDEALARQVQGEVSDAFEELVVRYEKRIYGFLLKRTGHVHDAQDLTQKTFLKAFRKMNTFKGNYRFSSWLYAIARNTAISHWRSHRETVDVTPPMAVDNEDPVRVLAAQETRTQLWDKAREILPEKQFSALWLRYGDGMSIAEIAGALQVGESNAKVLLHRGRKRLAKVLESRERITS